MSKKSAFPSHGVGTSCPICMPPSLSRIPRRPFGSHRDVCHGRHSPLLHRNLQDRTWLQWRCRGVGAWQMCEYHRSEADTSRCDKLSPSGTNVAPIAHALIARLLRRHQLLLSQVRSWTRIPRTRRSTPSCLASRVPLENHLRKYVRTERCAFSPSYHPRLDLPACAVRFPLARSLTMWFAAVP
ncbi:hypothetical protein BDW22DRAFT_317669 [Trametopsis cervina]|nr:hypothetical protein BDW22DRAFT_317669 [Trametopsis cervina]